VDELSQLLAELEAQDPEALQKMIDAGLFSDRSALAGQKMQQGQQMMGAPGAQGMNVGGTYVAASPLEHLSTAMTRGMGAQMMGGAQDQQAALVGQKGQGLEAFLRSLAGPGAAPPVQAPQMMGPDESIPYFLRMP
jgi:hypothetical protein